MASFLVKLIASNPLITARSAAILFRPVAASSSRFLNTTTFRKDESDDDGFNLEFRGKCTAAVHSLYNDAVCPRLSATSNLARLLNLFEDFNYFLCSDYEYPRWDVMEDPEALYLLRDMSGSADHVDFDFLPGEGSKHIIGCVHVHFTPGGIEITAVKNPDESSEYVGYFCKIDLPAKLYKDKDFEVAEIVKNKVLKITIPKQKDEWIKKITINAGLLV